MTHREFLFQAAVKSGLSPAEAKQCMLEADLAVISATGRPAAMVDREMEPSPDINKDIDLMCLLMKKLQEFPTAAVAKHADRQMKALARGFKASSN